MIAGFRLVADAKRIPRYFFNIFDGEEIFDDTGTVLSNMREVRVHMLAVAKAWIESETKSGRVWRLEARDDDENIVSEMRFGVEPDKPGF